MRSQPRNWPPALLVVCLVCCLLIGTIGIGIVAADDQYDLTVTDAVEVPSQTVDDPDLNQEHEIDAFAVRQPGESLDVTATVPDGESFYVDLYNSNQGWETGFTIEGSETVTFDSTTTDSLEPGTYSLMLDEIGGPVQAIHPVVISGYEISALYSGEADPDGTLDVEIDVTPTALEDDPAGVEVVLWNDDTVERIDATGSNGEYSASVDLDGLELDEYNIHVAALGEDEFRGRQEILGLSYQGTIEITESGSEIEEGGNGGSAGEPVDGGQQISDEDDSTNETDSDPEVDNGTETDVETDESTATVELIDEAPDSAGIQISFENTTAVRTLTLSNESASGNVTVTDRSTLPTYTAPPARTPIAIVQITVPDAERSSPATLELIVDHERVNDLEKLTIERYDSASDTWAELETTVSDTSDTEVTVTAETPGFSIFAVTEPDTESSSSSSDSNSGDVETETESETEETPVMPTEPEETPDPEDQPGFGVLSVIAAFIVLLSGFLYRRNR